MVHSGHWEKCNQARIWKEEKFCTLSWASALPNDSVFQIGSWELFKVAKSCSLWEKDIWVIAAVLRDLSLFQWELGMKLPYKVSHSLCWPRDMVASESQSRAGPAVHSLCAATTGWSHFSSSAALTWSPLRANTAPEYSAANTPFFLFRCQKLLGYLWLIMVVSF